MNRSNTKKNTTSLRLIEWLLDQLQSEGELDTISHQLAALVLPQQGKPKSNICTHISLGIFERYSANPDDHSAKLYEIIIALGGSWGRELLAELDREKTFPSPKPTPEEASNENNYGRHTPVHEPIVASSPRPAKTFGSTEFHLAMLDKLEEATLSIVPLANSAWSERPLQNSATSHAQSPTNIPSTSGSQPRRHSSPGPGGPRTLKQAPRGAASTGHRPTNSIHLGSIKVTQAPEEKVETTPPPATTLTTAPKLAQPPANDTKVVAHISTQRAQAPVKTTASTATTTSVTPSDTTPTSSKQKKVNIHDLFQGGGMPSTTTTSPVTTNLPTYQQQHPMDHPHHSPHLGYPMKAPPRWGPPGYYYPPPHDYNPYMYWGGHPQHQHQHMQQIQQPPTQHSQPPAAQPRPPPTPPVSSDSLPHPSPVNTSPKSPPSVPLPKVMAPIPPKRLAKEREEKERDAREKAEEKAGKAHKERRPLPLPISTTLATDRPKRPVSGLLDPASAQGNRSASPPPSVASFARPLRRQTSTGLRPRSLGPANFQSLSNCQSRSEAPSASRGDSISFTGGAASYLKPIRRSATQDGFRDGEHHKPESARGQRRRDRGSAVLDPPVKQDEFSFRLAQWLLDQLYSEEELKTVTQQFSVLISQAHSESIEALYAHIGRLIFQKFIRAKTQLARLCAHLCRSLFIANLKRRSDISARLTPIHEHLFQYCLGHLSGDHSEAQGSTRGTDGPSTDSTQPGACTSVALSGSEEDTALAISLLILELYKCGLVSVAHVYEYTFQLATLSKFGDLTSRLNAVHTLLDSCFSRLDTSLWKAELELLQDWAKSLVSDTNTDQVGVQQLTNLLNRMLNPEDPDANAGDLGTTFGRLSVSVTAQPIASGHDTNTSAGNDDGCSSDLNNIISDLRGIVHSPQSQIYDEEGEDSTGNNYGDYMYEAGSMESLDSPPKGDKARTTPALNSGTHRPQSKRYGHVLHPFAVVDPSQRESRPTRPTRLYPQHHFSSSESSFSSAGSVPALPVSSPSSMSSSVAALILNKKQKRDRLTKVVEAQVEQEKKVKERTEKAKRSREDTVLDWLERESTTSIDYLWLSDEVLLITIPHNPGYIELRSMSFASLGSSASSGNPSLAWVMGNGGKGRLVIEFPFSLNTGWYHEQSCTKFHTFQHRKERNALFQHEFIVLNLLDGSVCRIERMGDPNARFDALSPRGAVAYDMAQSFRPDELELACLESSDIVAEVELAEDLDLIDVLKVCRAIHEGEKTRNYTLQVFNCYFFSLAIQVCLTRLVARWEDQQWLGSWLFQIREGAAKLTDVFESIDSGMPRSLRAFDRIYSILAPEDSHDRTYTGRIVLKLQTWWNINDRSIEENLTNHVNNVLWHSAMHLELDQFIKAEIRQVMVGVLKGRLDNSTFRALDRRIGEGHKDAMFTGTGQASRTEKCQHRFESVSHIRQTKGTGGEPGYLLPGDNCHRDDVQERVNITRL
ncbi:unnamed protein product [Rhizoctonia solani]|uniref:Uncharacterized protein n=1 Tax=Rhizoctonia solani TaxID=456999 RepID=A0A8H3E6L8_9AGAM|nr:unnamed protein product [Rhizoctonia solani]